MNKLFNILLLASFLFAGKSAAQVNLVPNPGFEIYTVCPNSLSTTLIEQVNYATGWQAYRDTPDYFNSCATVSSGVNVPGNFFGYQQEDTGNAYCGIFTYLNADYREYIGCQLSSSLYIGQKYFVSFKINLADQSMVNMSTNKTGVLFSTVPYSETNPAPRNNFAHVYSNTIITDTLNWVTISGVFTADSAYSYLILGNFFDDTNTDTISTGPAPYKAYYYIDDVFVTTDSLNASSIPEAGKNSLHIFPNPAQSFLTIEFTNENYADNSTLTLYTLPGEKVMEKHIGFDNGKYVMSREGLSSGIYLLKVESGDSTFYRRIIFY